MNVWSLARAPQATVITLACFGTSDSGRSEIGNFTNNDICCCNGKLATCDVDRKYLLVAGQPHPFDMSMLLKNVAMDSAAARGRAFTSSTKV